MAYGQYDLFIDSICTPRPQLQREATRRVMTAAQAYKAAAAVSAHVGDPGPKSS